LSISLFDQALEDASLRSIQARIVVNPHRAINTEGPRHSIEVSREF